MQTQDYSVSGFAAVVDGPDGPEKVDCHTERCPCTEFGTPASHEFRFSPVLPVRVTKFYEHQIRQSEYCEQLRRIVEPLPEEASNAGTWDTSGECANTVVTGLQHKYAQTGLILVTDQCFSYCRFCFRKRFVGVRSDEVAVDYPAIAAYIRQHPEISNVLVSGGDPFTLSTAELDGIVTHLLPIPHLRSIRFGTKAIVHYPQRFRDERLKSLFERILQAGKVPVVVTHVDHVGEVSSETQASARELRALGVSLFNQSVLLNGVNDDPDVLAKTFRTLHGLGIRPYYLFQARPVTQGTHFQVPLRRGVAIVREVYRRLSGIEKTFRYVMSHPRGKIEILDLADDGRLYMRYHQCADASQVGKVFSRPYLEGACWLDELPDDVATDAWAGYPGVPQEACGIHDV